jgi:hypothetical protein
VGDDEGPHEVHACVGEDDSMDEDRVMELDGADEDRAMEAAATGRRKRRARKPRAASKGPV